MITPAAWAGHPVLMLSHRATEGTVMPLDSSDGGRRRASRNVLGGNLEPCSIDPVTGFYRDGCCNTGAEDVGSHTVCAVMTAEFLAFSQARGNDLSTRSEERRVGK